MKFKTAYIWIAVPILMILTCEGLWKYLLWGADTPDPVVSMDAIGGLTPEQVISRLGPPDSDPRNPVRGAPPGYKPWTSEAEDGPLQLLYNDGDFPDSFFHPHFGHDYSIIFENGRVSQVVCGRK